MHQTSYKGQTPLGSKTNYKAFVYKVLQKTDLTKSLKWELGQVLAIVLDDFGCQWQQPNSNWFKPTKGIYWLKR